MHCVVQRDAAGNPILPLRSRPFNTIRAAVGRRDLLNTTQGEDRGVSNVALQPQAQFDPLAYDIAVLTLDAPVTNITPAVLGTSQDWEHVGYAMGWGHTNYDHNNPQNPRYLQAGRFRTWHRSSAKACSTTLEPGITYFGAIRVLSDRLGRRRHVDLHHPRRQRRAVHGHRERRLEADRRD